MSSIATQSSPKPDLIDDRVILRALLEEMEEEAKAYEEAERQQQHWEMLQKQSEIGAPSESVVCSEPMKMWRRSGTRGAKNTDFPVYRL